MRAAAPTLRATPLGNQAVNYIVGLTSMGANILQRPDPFRVFLNDATVAVTLILIWATLTIAWSLDQTGAIDMTTSSWLDYFLRIVIGSFMLLSVKDLDRLWRYMVVLACALRILNPHQPGLHVPVRSTRLRRGQQDAEQSPGLGQSG